ncbi:hypothetical protein COLO4_17514 [Corchorus olitorius]|uniref:Uncharacterized protein n=1 Tax=Corchorus olitorius TaxID=93759 RepID=A0A1R3JCI1_9ROSI|nr:hypothetical protein COLO4_17514 [Corchorus olitorius]
MALVGNFLPKPTVMVLPVQFSKLSKPKTMIVCATPSKPPTRSGSGGQINSTLRVGVTDVTPNTTLADAGDVDNLQNNTNIANDDDAAVKGADEPTDI